MTRLQIVYERLVKIFLSLSVVSYLLFIFIVFFGITQEAFITGTTDFFPRIKEGYPLIRGTFWPLLIGIIIFLIATRIFYFLATRESNLMSVSYYKKMKLKDDKTKERMQHKREAFRKAHASVFTRINDFFSDILDGIKNFSRKTKKRYNKTIENMKKRKERKKELEDEIKEIEEKTKLKPTIKKRKALNKTALILKVSDQTKLTSMQSRKFVNALFSVIKETTIKEEAVTIDTFGTFDKIKLNKYSEINPETQKEITIKPHNTVFFFPDDQLKEKALENYVPEIPKDHSKDQDVTKEKAVEKESITKTSTTDKQNPTKKTKQQPQTKTKDEKAQREAPKKVKKPKKRHSKATKGTIVSEIYEKTDLSKNKSKQALNDILEVITNQLKTDETVYFGEIGYFEGIIIPEKDAVNPQTKEKIKVPAHKEIRFRFYDEFKDKFK
ncbi:MAG: HU family DNA-binding protein [Candidatus Izimaplasma sp.]|nr:HU family DNA-binding protein [Candidatus Izimaplasma bacterium]